MTRERHERRRWQIEGWVIGIIAVGVVFGLVLGGITALNADRAAGGAQQAARSDHALLLELTGIQKTDHAVTLQRDKELTTLLDTLVADHRTTSAILVQLKGDSDQIAAFAHVIESELRAVCTATECVIKIPIRH